MELCRTLTLDLGLRCLKRQLLCCGTMYEDCQYLDNQDYATGQDGRVLEDCLGVVVANKIHRGESNAHDEEDHNHGSVLLGVMFLVPSTTNPGKHTVDEWEADKQVAQSCGCPYIYSSHICPLYMY